MNVNRVMPDTDKRPFRCWPLPLTVAVIGLAGVIASLDSSGAVPKLGSGPGLTLDETFNVQMGVYHVRALREYGLALFHPDSAAEVFGVETYNPDHPPLGRLLIGLAHELTVPLFHPEVPPDAVCVTCGRIASAVGFALTIFLVGWTTSRWYGRAAGVIASVSMLLMPRLFAHAHLAALETLLNLTYVATILWIADRWSHVRLPKWRHVIIGGVLFGVCLLTKIQAVLLPAPLAVWALWRWRMRAVVPLTTFGLIGFAVFFAGWPWLWIDPITHLFEYFGRTTQRQTLYCWFLDRKWADVDVPWQYALVLFAVTVPVGLHVLGVLGLFSRVKSGEETAGDETAADDSSAHNPRSILILMNVVWPLAFFALPDITVYDGTRLFLMVCPLWAIIIGCGGAALLKWLSERTSPFIGGIAVCLLLATQSIGLIRMHPLGLSYYNAAAGGLSGAVDVGFEATYWGDSVTVGLLEDLVQQVPEGSVVDVAPVLHPFQLDELTTQSPALRHHNIRLRAYDDQSGEDIRYVLVFRRRADSWDTLTPAPDGELLSEVVRDGVQLAGLYKLR